MTFSPGKYHRRSIRLKEYDYSQPGIYFVSICTHNQECLLGEVVEGRMASNEFGNVVEAYWEKLAHRYPEAKSDALVVMPNHVHSIITVGAIHELPLHELPLQYRRRALIPKIVGWFKMNTSKRINQMRHTPGIPVWQRNYWEHIIRNEDSLNRIREYILNNPLRWHLDRENPNRTGNDDLYPCRGNS